MVNFTENGQKMSKKWEKLALIKINPREFPRSFFNSVSVFGKLRQLYLTYLPVFSPSPILHPKPWGQIWVIFKKSRFLAKFSINELLTCGIYQWFRYLYLSKLTQGRWGKVFGELLRIINEVINN